LIIFYINRYVNKNTELSDLEKYFKQQAVLAEQRKKFKKASKKSSDKNKLIPAKKTKMLSNTNTRSSKIYQKSKMDEDTKDNILHTVEAGSSNTTNEVIERDLSSGSEYIPSDKEVDSGNINIYILSKYVQKY